jgi:hypothetical protein
MNTLIVIPLAGKDEGESDVSIALVHWTYSLFDWLEHYQKVKDVGLISKSWQLVACTINILWSSMEQHVFCIFNYYRGHHRNGDAIYNKSIYNKKLYFIDQEMYFWTLQIDSNKQTFTNWHYFCHNTILMPFLRAALYRLILLLHKGALFH